MAQTNFTPIQLYYSTTGAAAPTAGNLANGELAINITDGKLFYKDNLGAVQVLATKAGASGDVVGPASSTDNALVRFDTTTGKLVQNSVGILDDSGNLTGLAAVTMSGALTLSGGTANGVAYLNASKVLTTGSALTFDGTILSATSAAIGGALGMTVGGALSGTTINSTGISLAGSQNLNFGGTAQRITGDFSNATVSSRVTFQSSTTNGSTVISAIPNGTSQLSQFVAYNNSDLSGLFQTAQLVSLGTEASVRAGISTGATYLPMTFYTGGSERLRIDTSGNVGIGTSSPNSLLSVVNSGSSGTATDNCRVFVSSSNRTGFIQLDSVNGVNGNSSVVFSAGGTEQGRILYKADSNYMYFSTATAERMRIDSSGQVGIGFTPQATQGNLQVYKLVSGGAPATSGTTDANQVLGVNGSSVQLSYGVYANGTGWIQQRAGGNFAVNYDLVLQPNGGNVGIGTNSPTSVSGYGALTLNGTTGSFLALRTNGTDTAYVQTNASSFDLKGVNNVPMILYTNNTERARITAAGALLVGTTANNGEKVRFSLGSVSPATSGNMTTGAIFQGGDGDRALNLATDASGVWYNSGFANNAGVAGVHRWLVGGTERMSLSTTGIVTMSAYGAGAATFSAAGVISSVSDETWKTKDGAPVDPDAMLKKLEPGYWYYNDEKKPIFGAERQLGFYAQNVNAAIGPEAAPTPEEGKPWGYYDRSVLAVVVMSLQKALATIESLEDRIATLESKP